LTAAILSSPKHAHASPRGVAKGDEVASTDEELAAVEETVETFSNSHRVWFLPILAALEHRGGRARPKDVRDVIRANAASGLEQQHWDYLVEKNRLGWSRLSLRQAGLLAGERGWWELTELGRAYLAAHRHEMRPIELDSIPREQVEEDVVTELVDATDFKAYEIPLLEVMSDGLTAKQEILDVLLVKLRERLLPGDLRQTKRGEPLWRSRASWALSYLNKDGLIKNTGRGLWAITETGRAHLRTEREGYDITRFRQSKSRVLVEGATSSAPQDGEVDAPAGWSADRWQKLSATLGRELFNTVDQRLRPDFGPTPASEARYVGRNVVFYGPPGTGKTYLARAVARALTGDEQPGPDSRWRIVQFHPSYAYEDFIQGLKPDLEKVELRYVLRQGPFMELCQAAEDDPDEFYVLIIDEINRGDPARIFGELLYALEYRGQAVDLPLGGQLTVPPNLVIVGTMNSVDRSVALVDYALRRRFGFVRVAPNPEVIGDERGDQAMAQVAAMVLRSFNEWVAQRLDREHVLGHSFFLNAAIPLSDEAALERIWKVDVYPLLEEYFFGEPESLKEARQEWGKAVKQALAEQAEAGDDDVSEADGAAGADASGEPAVSSGSEGHQGAGG
jgi:5-methylcytosine-specific restriction protein B